MGQNFLVEPAVVARIADLASIGPDDLVLEIGPGMGILSREILGRGAHLVAVELDRELAGFLRSDIDEPARFRLIEQDARYLDPFGMFGGRPYVVVANLPYSVATTIIRRLVESDASPVAMTVMVQREVAERMTRADGNTSLLSLATSIYSEASIGFIVPANVFLPPPKVDSAVVRMDIRSEPLGTEEQRARTFELATMAFQRKRKTIGNGLSQGLDRAKSSVEQALTAAGIDPGRRPQTLSVEEWLAVAAAIPS